jgi:hypothetical protein
LKLGPTARVCPLLIARARIAAGVGDRSSSPLFSTRAVSSTSGVAALRL